MNNEEAITILEELARCCNYEVDINSKDVEALNKAIKVLKNERPHGKWKDITPNHYFTCGGEPLVICPFCGDQESKHVQGIENNMWNFCPICGADMREGRQ